VVQSHTVFLDILPPRASKGKAIRYLTRKWGLRSHDVAVAGDSGNDEEMLTARFHGIVVGNHAEELSHLRGRRSIYFAGGELARGVLEGLEKLGFLDAPGSAAPESAAAPDAAGPRRAS
jgi:sucrose-phosphate synthase